MSKLQLVSLNSDLETRIFRNQFEYVFHEFIKNSIQFPAAIALLEILILKHSLQITIAHILILFVGSSIQAIYIGINAYSKTPRYFLGNIIGVSFCFIFNSSIYGIGPALNDQICQMYLANSVLIGLFQELRWKIAFEYFRHLTILLENFTKVVFLILPFWVYHAMEYHDIITWPSLLDHPLYIYLTVIIGIYGILMGMANINSFRYFHTLQSTANDLRKYSEWFLGPSLLGQSVNNPSILNLTKVKRSILFMDIRGFTKWSGNKSPQDVVDLVNHFFQISVTSLNHRKAIKIELTGDEVMAVFDNPEAALTGALILVNNVMPILARESLSAGVGINTGPVVEGLVGGQLMKKFSVIGDTVNIGKRICDMAGAGEILIDEHSAKSLSPAFQFEDSREVYVKGKSEKLTLHSMSFQNAFKYAQRISNGESEINLPPQPSNYFEQLVRYAKALLNPSGKFYRPVIQVTDDPVEAQDQAKGNLLEPLGDEA